MERLGDQVARRLRGFGPQGAMADVVAAWPGAVGEAIARNAWPARLARDGTLHVATSSSAWAFELAHLAPQLSVRLRESLGELAPAGLRFAPGRLPERGAEAAPAAGAAPCEATPEERELGASLAAGIEDEDLRELVARAAAASLAGRRGGR